MDKVLLNGHISNTAKGISDLLKTLKNAGYKDLGWILFGMGNTGIHSNPLKIYAVEKGLDLVVSNALDIANSKGIRREKSDSADAYLIAQYLRKNLPTIRTYKSDNEVVVKIKHLQSARQLLLKQKNDMSMK
jgi:transposase